jgi:hypothetical protein
MPFFIRTAKDAEMAISTCSGELRLGDAKTAVAAFWNAPAKPGQSGIGDFRDARFERSTSDVRTLAEFVLQNQPTTPPKKIAFVTTRDADFGMARMFEVFRQEARTEFRVFRNYDEAITWAQSVGPGAIPLRSDPRPSTKRVER